MAVLAECHSCDRVYPLGERVNAETTTACPNCGQLSYTSLAVDVDLDDEAARIKMLVCGAEGVGPSVLDNIVDEFLTVKRLRNASLAELLDVPGIGPRTAERIDRELDTTILDQEVEG